MTEWIWNSVRYAKGIVISSRRTQLAVKTAKGLTATAKQAGRDLNWKC